jgi:hypothetical protein
METARTDSPIYSVSYYQIKRSIYCCFYLQFDTRFIVFNFIPGVIKNVKVYFHPGAKFVNADAPIDPLIHSLILSSVDIA